MAGDTEAIQRAAERMAQADGLLVTAGAGMGEDSGLPDFRGPPGFWKADPALGRRSISFEEIAHPAHFHTAPRLAWGFHRHRSVEGRFQAAGFGAMRQAECHGSIHHLPCAGPCSDALWFSHAAVIDRDAVPVRIDPDALEVPRREDVSIAGRALAASHAIDEALGRE